MRRQNYGNFRAGNSLGKTHKQLETRKAGKEAAKVVEKMVIPKVTTGLLCCICLVMHDKFGWGNKRLNALMYEIGELFQDILDDRLSIDDCVEEVKVKTGIDIPELKGSVL